MIALTTYVAAIFGRLLAAVAKRADITLAKLRALSTDHDVPVGVATLRRVFTRWTITLAKKSGHAAEQDRPVC